MNGRQVKTLGLVLSGLCSKMDGNPDFFRYVCFAFRSGAQTYDGRLDRDADAFMLVFTGVKRRLGFDEFCEYLSAQAPVYDQLALEYHEKNSVTVVTASNDGVRTKTEASENHMETGDVHPAPSSREYMIRADRARDLLFEMGILTKEGKVKNDMIRKYNQVDRFVELAASYIKRLGNTVEVLDCGCGKSHLSFALNYYIREVLSKRCHITGVDLLPGVVDTARERAKRLGYTNMDFVCADLGDYNPGNIDMCISLHACDTATDLAIAKAVQAGARFIACVPCCHKELLGSLRLEAISPLLGHNIIKARMNDVITDALRIKKLEALGYAVTALEYVSPLDTPKNLLILAERVSGGNKAAAGEYATMIKMMGVRPALDVYLG